MQIEKSFDVVDGQYIPTIKISLDPCLADDSDAWELRDALAQYVTQTLEKIIKEAKHG